MVSTANEVVVTSESELRNELESFNSNNTRNKTITVHPKSDGSDYTFSSPLPTIDGYEDYRQTLNIVGSGDITFSFDMSNFLLAVRGAEYSSSPETLESDALAGQGSPSEGQQEEDGEDVLDFPAKLLTPGDLIVVHDDSDLMGDGNEIGESHVAEDGVNLTSDSNEEVLIDESIVRDYLTSNDAMVNFYSPVEFHMENITLDGPGPTSGSGNGLRLRHCIDSTLKDLHVKNCSISGLHIGESYDVTVDGGTYERCRDTDQGYGIVIYDACSHVTIRNAVITNCRHGIANGATYRDTLTGSDGSGRYGQSRNVVIDNCKFGTSFFHQVDSHTGSCESMFVRNCHFQCGGEMPIESGATHNVFEGNQVYDAWRVGVRSGSDPETYRVRNNVFKRCIEHESDWPSRSEMTLHNNYFDYR